MDQDRRSLLTKGVVVVALVIGLALTLRWFMRSDYQRISDAIDDARDALVERRDDDFLRFFTEDVVYQDKGSLAAIERDVGRWHELSVLKVYVLEREIEVDGYEAAISLVVAAGQGITQWGQVDVELEAEKGEDGEWHVRSFSWRRR
jgi:hypothetical protein